MNTRNYPDPVAKLLTYRECHMGESWPNYLDEFGITKEHIPYLIDIATDLSFNKADSESLEIWGPVHAWRALAQLKAETAVEPLLELLEDSDNYWAHEELPVVIGEIGNPALIYIEVFLSDLSHSNDAFVHIIRCLSSIGERHLPARQTCIGIMMKKLEDYQINGSILNGYIIKDLCQFGAREAKPLIQQAFEIDQVDPEIIEREDVQECLGTL